MVLGPDRFAVKDLIPRAAESWNQLVAHLSGQQLAVFLIKRRENGNLHWVAVREGSHKKIKVYDSLHLEPYLEREDFLKNM